MSFMDLPPVETRGRGRCIATSPPAEALSPVAPMMPSYSGALTGGGNRQLWKTQAPVVVGVERPKELRRPKSESSNDGSPVDIMMQQSDAILDPPVPLVPTIIAAAPLVVPSAPSAPIVVPSTPSAPLVVPSTTSAAPLMVPATPSLSSTLSVDAKEFVPRGRVSLESIPINEVKEFVPRSLRQPTTIPREPERVFPEFIPRGAVNMPDVLPQEFVPRRQQPEIIPREMEAELWDDFMPPAEYRRPVLDNGVTAKEAAVKDLVEIMDHIAVMPESFDKMVSALLDAFTCWLEDEETTVAVVDALFERSLLDANFRFNGVRMCGLVSSQVDKQFRTQLLKRCHVEHTLALSSVASAPQRTHGYLLLIADLYVTLEVVPGSRTKIDVLGRAVMEVMNTLIALPTSDNVKCICDTLKLAGFHLNLLDQPSVDALFKQLNKINMDRNTPATVQLSVLKVTTLRSENWGLGNVSAPTYSAPANNNPGNGPVFYGPDGNELTPEENQFLQENSSASLDVDLDDNDAYTFRDTVWDQDMVMNAEVQAAYEQFCRLND